MLCLSMNRQAILPAQMDPFSTLKNLMYGECMYQFLRYNKTTPKLRGLELQEFIIVHEFMGQLDISAGLSQASAGRFADFDWEYTYMFWV